MRVGLEGHVGSGGLGGIDGEGLVAVVNDPQLRGNRFDSLLLEKYIYLLS